MAHFVIIYLHENNKCAAFNRNFVLFCLIFCESQTSLHIVKLKLDLLQKPTVGLKLIVAKY